MGKILCVANQKGGVGKTTTAVNLAASLAISDQRVLMVDLDPQANASAGVGVRGQDGIPGTYELLTSSIETVKTIHTTELENLHLIPSGRDLVGAQVELVQAPRREYLLKNALVKVADRYDYILIDCPPSLGLLTLNALVAAQTVLIPMQCEYYALEGLGQLLHTIQRVKRKLNPGLDVEGILLTMFDGRNNLSRQVVAEVSKHFGPKVFKTIIPRNVRLSEAPSHGQPAIIYDPRSAGAQGYLGLAKEMLG